MGDAVNRFDVPVGWSRLALALLLMAAAVGVLGTPAARAQDEPAAYGCGVKEFEVTLESVVGAEEAEQTPAGEPVPVGLYRPVKQIFGVISDTIGIPTHITSLGVFCLEPGGTVPVQTYEGHVNSISIAEDGNGPLVIELEPSGLKTEIELCDSTRCDAVAVPVDQSRIELGPGQALRLTNARFGLANPGDAAIVFSIANIAPASAGCPTKCWVSP